MYVKTQENVRTFWKNDTITLKQLRYIVFILRMRNTIISILHRYH